MGEGHEKSMQLTSILLVPHWGTRVYNLNSDFSKWLHTNFLRFSKTHTDSMNARKNLYTSTLFSDFFWFGVS